MPKGMRPKVPDLCSHCGPLKLTARSAGLEPATLVLQALPVTARPALP